MSETVRSQCLTERQCFQIEVWQTKPKSDVQLCENINFDLIVFFSLRFLFIERNKDDSTIFIDIFHDNYLLWSETHLLVLATQRFSIYRTINTIWQFMEFNRTQNIARRKYFRFVQSVVWRCCRNLSILSSGTIVSWCRACQNYSDNWCRTFLRSRCFLWQRQRGSNCREFIQYARHSMEIVTCKTITDIHIGKAKRHDASNNSNWWKSTTKIGSDGRTKWSGRCERIGHEVSKTRLKIFYIAHAQTSLTISGLSSILYRVAVVVGAFCSCNVDFNHVLFLFSLASQICTRHYWNCCVWLAGQYNWRPKSFVSCNWKTSQQWRTNQRYTFNWIIFMSRVSKFFFISFNSRVRSYYLLQHPYKLQFEWNVWICLTLILDSIEIIWN